MSYADWSNPLPCTFKYAPRVCLMPHISNKHIFDVPLDLLTRESEQARLCGSGLQPRSQLYLWSAFPVTRKWTVSLDDTEGVLSARVFAC